MTPLPIGAAVLDSAARTLAGPGGAVRLPTQALALLARLAARPGVVVRWDEAIDAVYGPGPCRGRDPYAVAVARLVPIRRALRETGAGAEIETLRGVGVRLRVQGHSVRMPDGRGEAPPAAGADPRRAA